MKNHYFKVNDPLCYSEADIREYMTENNTTEIQVFKAKRELRTGYFFLQITVLSRLRPIHVKVMDGLCAQFINSLNTKEQPIKETPLQMALF